METLEDFEPMKLIVRFPCIFGIWVTFPVDEVFVLSGVSVETPVKNAFWDVMLFAMNDNRRRFLLYLARKTFLEWLKLRDMERVVDFHGRREIKPKDEVRYLFDDLEGTEELMIQLGRRPGCRDVSGVKPNFISYGVERVVGEVQM
jgi:hypothetical protein